MNKYFLCLANSYKHDNRCLAGVLMDLSADGFRIQLDRWGHATWFRPVSRIGKAGAIPNDEALAIQLFDIVLVTEIEECPEGAQKENSYYHQLQVVGHWEPDIAILDKIAQTSRKVLFGNPAAFVTHDYYEKLSYSIFMIKVDNVQCYLKERENKQPQPRMKFGYNGYPYDFPVTDPDFRHIIEADLSKANRAKCYYLTLSLGAICEDKHFKLVAGVYQHESNAATPPTPIPQTAIESYSLFKKKMSISQIAAQRGYAESTIKNHLLYFVQNGLINIHELVPAAHIQCVKMYYDLHPEELTMKACYEAYDGQISYDDIRFVLAAKGLLLKMEEGRPCTNNELIE